MTKNYVKISNKVSLLIEFYEKFGKWPTLREEYQGIKIGYFMNNIKFHKIILNDFDISRLEQFGFIIVPLETQKIDLIIDFFNECGNWPNFSKTILGNFLLSIKEGRVLISSTNKQRLAKLGFFN